MKNSFNICSIFVIITGLFLGFSCTGGESSGDETESEVHNMTGKSLPLIYQMSFMSRYTHKLYLAGAAQNWELADIYSHEIEEIAVEIIEGNHVDDGVNISELMEAMLLPQIEQMEGAIDRGEPAHFEESYNTLIQTCNQCHDASNYGAVQVSIPQSNPFNQEF